MYNNTKDNKKNIFVKCRIIEEPVFNKLEDTNEIYFLIKVMDKHNNYFDVGISSNADNDYRKYYKGREIKIKMDNSGDIIKAIDVKFNEKDSEYEL